MTASYGAAKTYKQQGVMTSSREKLVVLLYEAAMRELEQARSGLGDRKTAARVGESLGKAFSIVTELRSALNHEEAPEISIKLEQLYNFVTDRITIANRERQEESILEALKILRELKEGWDGILQST